MKANATKTSLKTTLAFCVSVLLFFLINSCIEPLLKASVTISLAENVTTTSATLVASVIPNQDNTVVSFEYQTANSAWTSKTLEEKFSGSSSKKVTLDLSDLQPSTLYTFKVTAVNSYGSVTSSTSSFTTGVPKSIIKIKSAENVKISTAKLMASVIPNQPNTIISFEYQTTNSAWQSQTLPTSFSGTDSVKVTFDLSDLQPNTEYNFRVKAVNRAGEEISAVSSFTTYEVADYDGNLYHTVTIGTQTWLQENFKGTHFANGDAIANVTGQSDWDNMKTPAYCWYNNNSKIGEVYGGLYNFYVANDPRGLIIGWHTPSLEEWTTLSDYLGGADIAGGKMKEAGFAHWIQPNAGATNSSGFTGLPSGIRQDNFGHLGDGVGFWSTTQFMNMSNVAFIPSLGQSSSLLQLHGASDYYYAYSIRVIKN